jgi:hypothetical protein
MVQPRWQGRSSRVSNTLTLGNRPASWFTTCFPKEDRRETHLLDSAISFQPGSSRASPNLNIPAHHRGVSGKSLPGQSFLYLVLHPAMRYPSIHIGQCRMKWKTTALAGILCCALGLLPMRLRGSGLQSAHIPDDVKAHHQKLYDSYYHGKNIFDETKAGHDVDITAQRFVDSVPS